MAGKDLGWIEMTTFQNRGQLGGLWCTQQESSQQDQKQEKQQEQQQQEQDQQEQEQK